MGVSNSRDTKKSFNPFAKTYLQARKETRKNLILKFIDNPENSDILSNIRYLRNLIIKDKEIFAKAYRESVYKYDVSPTCVEGAEFELKRL